MERDLTAPDPLVGRRRTAQRERGRGEGVAPELWDIARLEPHAALQRVGGDGAGIVAGGG